MNTIVPAHQQEQLPSGSTRQPPLSSRPWLLRHPKWLVFLMSFPLVFGVYLGLGQPVPTPLFLLCYFGMLWFCAHWIDDDSARRGVPSLSRQGMAIFLAWPIVVPVHILSTRGWKGFLLLFALAGATLLLFFSSIVIAAVIRLLCMG